jgi:transposase
MIDYNNKHLIDALRSKCKDENMSLRQLAKKLEVSSALINLIIHNKRRAGRKLQQAIVKHYPDLKDAVLQDITSKNN